MGTLVSLAVAVSRMFYVGGVCTARCRALLNKQKLGGSCMRACARAAAFQHAARNHTIGMGTLVSLAVAVSVMIYVGGFCIARCRALLDKQKLCGSCMRSCARAAALQHAARNHTIGMGTLVSLAVAVSATFYVGGVCIARCLALLDKRELGESVLRLCGRAAEFQPAARNHTKGMGGAFKFGDGGFSHVLRRQFLERVLRCTAG